MSINDLTDHSTEGRDFRGYVRNTLETLLERSAITGERLEVIDDHLERLNSKVATHETSIGELNTQQKIDQALHAAKHGVGDRLMPFVVAIAAWALGHFFK